MQAGGSNMKELGLGAFVLILLAMWLLILISFCLSFVKQKCVSTVSYMFFILACALFAYATADETSFSKPINTATMQEIIFAIIPILSCLISFVSGILWFCGKKKRARWFGLISILSTIYIYMHI
jgi:phosphoglycerol transferase MdoB-like AlkP superfamily enzyme